MKNKIILRKCIGCMEVINRDNLLRITKLHDKNELIINPNSKQFGRSFYLCYNVNCLDNILKKKKLNKLLKTNITDEFIEKLKQNIKDGVENQNGKKRGF